MEVNEGDEWIEFYRLSERMEIEEEGVPGNMRKRLAVAVRSIQWSYAIFWSLSPTQHGYRFFFCPSLSLYVVAFTMFPSIETCYLWKFNSDLPLETELFSLQSSSLYVCDYEARNSSIKFKFFDEGLICGWILSTFEVYWSGVMATITGTSRLGRLSKPGNLNQIRLG